MLQVEIKRGHRVEDIYLDTLRVEHPLDHAGRSPQPHREAVGKR